MLSLFPDLLDWSWYAPLLFRLFLGAYCCYAAFTLARTRTARQNDGDRLAWLYLRVFFVLLGILFILGITVQALGALGAILALFALYLRFTHSSYATESIAFYLLIGIVSFSLLLLGAGPYAFDLPL